MSKGQFLWWKFKTHGGIGVWGVLINIILIRIRASMQGKFRVQKKFSYSPGRVKENVYRVRARISKKNTHIPYIEVRERFIEPSHTVYNSNHKIRSPQSKLFERAKKVSSAQTFLANQQVYKLSKDSEPNSPLSSDSRKPVLHSTLQRPKNQRSLSVSRQEGSNEKKRCNAIQKTVSILIEGKEIQVKNEQELMTTLSRLILGEVEQEGDIYLEFEESSIHGDEVNFLDMKSDVLGETLRGKNHQIVRV